MKKLKRFLSVFLALVLLVSAVPVDVKATESETKIFVESKNVTLGEEVSVAVCIQNNPGIFGATLEFTFDEGLKLIDATAGDAVAHLTMTKPGKYSSPCRFVWDGQEVTDEDIRDGVIVTLTFEIEEDVTLGTPLMISVGIPNGDIYDGELNPIEVVTEDGSVTVRNFEPGDVNEDGLVNVSDIILVRRYLVGGYDVTINENAANVNDDKIVSSSDIVLIRRYVAGGYGVELLPPSNLICKHEMEATEYKAPTCTEEGMVAHWYCMSCHKFFSDEDGNQEIKQEVTIIPENGHIVVIDPVVEPTYTQTGLTEGSHCSVCGEVLKAQEEIPKLERNEYAVTYYIWNGDTYLQGLDIGNPNPNTYAKQEGLELRGLDNMVKGYTFLGWYTEPEGGVRVTEIAVGSTGTKSFYAHWSKTKYTITFDSPDVEYIKTDTYTVDTGYADLDAPKQYGYTFVGWSNDKGFIVDEIKPGTTGNITLHANWTSDRNKAVSYAKYAEPIIIEDAKNGQFLFIYDIGRIDNVPLSEIDNMGKRPLLDYEETKTVTDLISSENATTIANMVSNATTRSSGWTLSEEWEQVYGVEQETETSQVKSEERTNSEGTIVGGNYFVSNSEGGSSYVSKESGGASSSSSKVTTDVSVGINESYDEEVEKYADGKLQAGFGTGTSVGASFPVKLVQVSAGIDRTFSIGGELSSGKRTNTAVHEDSQASAYIGTVATKDSSSYYNVSANQSSTWNSTSGYKKSYETSRDTAVTKAISEAIKDTTKYNLSKSLANTNTKTESVAGTDTRSEEYSTTVKYSTQASKSETKVLKYKNPEAGVYRIVEAGTIHVYGIVGYDVATASYYTYTFNVPADTTYEMLDYSKEDALFKDCENGVVTFEIPFEVCEYISSVTGKTDGIEFDRGRITGFDAKLNTEFDGTVVIPQYYSVNNMDGTYSAYKTVAFDASTFCGNTEIKTVVLPTYITEIPDGAFAGCKNLETVIAYGVTKIGANAFKGCTSLKSFSIDNMITEIGANAFENVAEIKVMAANSEVADAAIKSGAKRIILNISVMEGSFDDKKVVILENTDYFAFISNGKEYNNLQIESEAKETFISNVKFVNNVNTPLKLDSESVTLARVTVKNSPGFALILPADNTNVYLFEDIELSSKEASAVISKNVILGKANAEAAGKLELTGDYLVCGTVTNEKYLNFTKGELRTIDEAEFDNRLTSAVVTFDANGGTVEPKAKTVYYGQKYGTLPVPTKQYHTFQGWYTAASGGIKVTENTVVDALVNQTLYAQWKVNTYTLTFNANGGSVSEKSRTATCGQAIGTLPTPTRDYHKFEGWYTAATGGTKVTNTTAFNAATTIYAHWTPGDVSGWVKASEMPAGAQIVNTKWTYTLREYKESSNSSMSGYTKYDTKRTSWGEQQGPVYSDPSNGARNVRSEPYVVSSNYKTVYHYFRYSTQRTGGNGSTRQSSSFPTYYAYDFDYELIYPGTVSYGETGYQYYYNAPTANTKSGKYSTIWKASPFTTQEWVSDNWGTRWYYQEPVYTYYFYRDVNKEATSDPTGQANVSNVVKYVQYRAK